MRKSLDRILTKLIRDESGAATTEYAVVAGLIIMGVIAVLFQFGPSVLARWSNVTEKLGGGQGAVVASTPHSAPNVP
jgi:Flp pilus assembly pilin Flp